MSVRRLPIVTIVLIVVCVLAHAVMSIGGSGREESAMSAMLTARLLYLQDPALGICPPLKPFVAQVSATGKLGSWLDRPDAAPKQGLESAYATACDDLSRAVAALPSQRFGYVPARPTWLGLFTYVFVHADWWHVVGNVWFLFLCGLALEDRWGRLPFAAYYVVSGVVSAGVHQLMTADAGAALIGASGAVAGAMGAFVVLFATTKIRFVGFFAFRIVSFAAPAYVMLPLWALVEVGYGALASTSGTAHWAHVGGFAFGAGVAGAFRLAGVDRKLDDAVERAAIIGSDPRIVTARGLVVKGEAAQAMAMLEGLAKVKPESVHVWEALRDVARVHGDTAAADAADAQVAAIEAARSGWPSGHASSRSSTPTAPSSSPMRHASMRTSVADPAPGVQSVASKSKSESGPAVAAATPFFPPPPHRK